MGDRDHGSDGLYFYAKDDENLTAEVVDALDTTGAGDATLAKLADYSPKHLHSIWRKGHPALETGVRGSKTVKFRGASVF